MAQGRVVWREVRMSDVPTTREPVPCPRWNDYQVVQRAAMNHSYSILQNAPSLSQTAGRSVNRLANQSVRRAERRLIPSDLDTPRYRKLAKVKATQITKLYLNQHSEKWSAGYFISHIPSFPPLIDVWPVMNGCNLWSLGDEIIQSCFYFIFFTGAETCGWLGTLNWYAQSHSLLPGVCSTEIEQSQPIRLQWIMTIASKTFMQTVLTSAHAQINFASSHKHMQRLQLTYTCMHGSEH